MTIGRLRKPVLIAPEGSRNEPVLGYDVADPDDHPVMICQRL